jgi:lipopolysaccharide export LptBFGC system permease protein LptF
MPQLTTRQLLRRHAAPFAVSFASLTILMLANTAARLVPQVSARGASASGIIEALLLSVPHTVALTIPMAVFLAASWAFMRLGAEGVLAAARRERHGIRRLVAPVLGAAAIIAAFTFVSNAELVPRANTRLVAVIRGGPIGPTDRTMTLPELRAAYQVEVQKKFALAAACVVLALVGAAIAIRVPQGGIGLVCGASGLVFTGYYLLLVAGESLADRQMLSPLIAIWIANGVLVAAALLLIRRPVAPSG